MASRINIDWSTVQLGIVPDRIIAEQLGCDPSAVRYQRLRRGLPHIPMPSRRKRGRRVGQKAPAPVYVPRTAASLDVQRAAWEAAPRPSGWSMGCRTCRKGSELKATLEGVYCYRHWMELQPCQCGHAYHDQGYDVCSACERLEYTHLHRQHHRQADATIYPSG
jgi:hypothetical protein